MPKILNEKGMVLFESPSDSFVGCLLANQYLRGAQLQNVDLSGADLRDANLSDANLTAASLSSANLDNANFENAELNSTDLSKSSCKNTSFKNANLKKAKFMGAELNGTDFTEAKATDSDFSRSVFEDCILDRTDFNDSVFNYAEGTITWNFNDVRGADFSRGDRLRFICYIDFQRKDKIFQWPGYDFNLLNQQAHGPWFDSRTKWGLRSFPRRSIQWEPIFLVACIGFIFGLIAMNVFTSPLTTLLGFTFLPAIVFGGWQYRATLLINQLVENEPWTVFGSCGHYFERTANIFEYFEEPSAKRLRKEYMESLANQD